MYLFRRSDADKPSFDNTNEELKQIIYYPPHKTTNVMTRIPFLLVLALFVACSDDEEPVACEVQFEPFRFRTIDQSGNNSLASNNAPDDIRLFYVDEGAEKSIEVTIIESDELTYASSTDLSLISINIGIDNFFLDRDGSVDTLLVNVSDASTSECNAYVFDAIEFNGAAAPLDSAATPPVYILSE